MLDMLDNVNGTGKGQNLYHSNETLVAHRVFIFLQLILAPCMSRLSIDLANLPSKCACL